MTFKACFKLKESLNTHDLFPDHGMCSALAVMTCHIKESACVVTLNTLALGSTYLPHSLISLYRRAPLIQVQVRRAEKPFLQFETKRCIIHVQISLLSCLTLLMLRSQGNCFEMATVMLHVLRKRLLGTITPSIMRSLSRLFCGSFKGARVRSEAPRANELMKSNEA